MSDQSRTNPTPNKLSELDRKPNSAQPKSKGKRVVFTCCGTIAGVGLFLTAVLFAVILWSWQVPKFRINQTRRAIETHGGSLQVKSMLGGPYLSSITGFHVDFSKSDLSDNDLQELVPHFRHLDRHGVITVLDLSQTPVTADGLQHLAEVEHIWAIDISDTSLEAKDVMRASIGNGLVKIINNSGPHAISTSGFTQLLFSPDGKELLVLGDKPIWVVATDSGEHRVMSQTGRVGTFSSDGQLLALTGVRGATVVDVKTGANVAEFPMQTQTPSAVAFGPNGETLFVGEFGTTHQYRLSDAKLIYSEQSFLSGVSRSFSGWPINGSKQWLHPVRGQHTILFSLTPTQARMTALSPDGKTIACVGSKNNANRTPEIVFMDTATMSVKKTISTGHLIHPMAMDFAQNGRRIVIGSTTGEVAVFDLESGERVFHFQDTSGAVIEVCLSDDGTQVAAGFEQSSVKWWTMD